jgi:hypothetical protein
MSTVFVDESAHRRHLLARWGYVAATVCLVYLVMLGVSFTTSPIIKPAGGAVLGPNVTDAAVPTTPARPSAAEPLTPRTANPPSTTALPDDNAARETLRRSHLGVPLATRHALAEQPSTTQPVPTSRSHRDNNARTAPPTPTSKQRR